MRIVILFAPVLLERFCADCHVNGEYDRSYRIYIPLQLTQTQAPQRLSIIIALTHMIDFTNLN